jgi:hypothetical protein
LTLRKLPAADEGAAVAILDVLNGEGKALAAALQARGLRAGYRHAMLEQQDDNNVIQLPKLFLGQSLDRVSPSWHGLISGFSRRPQ